MTGLITATVESSADESSCASRVFAAIVVGRVGFTIYVYIGLRQVLLGKNANASGFWAAGVWVVNEGCPDAVAPCFSVSLFISA